MIRKKLVEKVQQQYLEIARAMECESEVYFSKSNIICPPQWKMDTILPNNSTMKNATTKVQNVQAKVQNAPAKVQIEPGISPNAPMKVKIETTILQSDQTKVESDQHNSKLDETMNKLSEPKDKLGDTLNMELHEKDNINLDKKNGSKVDDRMKNVEKENALVNEIVNGKSVDEIEKDLKWLKEALVMRMEVRILYLFYASVKTRW